MQLIWIVAARHESMMHSDRAALSPPHKTFRCAVQQHYPQQQHSSYAAPNSYVRPAPMAATAYAAQPAPYTAAPMYPPQQPAGYGEMLSLLTCNCFEECHKPSFYKYVLAGIHVMLVASHFSHMHFPQAVLIRAAI